MPNDTYTIDLPGFSDFIRIPALEDYQLKAQRIERMKTHVSPVPDFLQWIPSVINMLDDAQDLLFTGLVLAKPLLTRLPARFLPGLGWILTANDALNVGTAVLGTALAGKGPKKAALNAIEVLSGGKARRVNRIAQFLTASQWFGFAIQAPQATESLTGYGLQLGSLMGAITDSTWATIRALDGNQVEFRSPPPDNLFEKSVDFLLEAPYQVFGGQILSEADHTLLLAAGSLAATIVAERGTPAPIRDRFQALAQTQVPIRRPWQASSIAALAAAGMPPGAPQRPFVATPGPRPTFLEAARLGAASTDRFQREMRDVYGPTSRGTLASMLMSQTGSTLWDFVHGQAGSTSPVYDEFDIFLMSAIEFNVFPPRPIKSADLLAWYRGARAQAYYRGADTPNRGDIQRAATETLAGWTSREVGWT